MTLGTFAIFIYLDKKSKHLEKVEHLNGLAKTDPIAGAILVLLLLSLIGLPLTAGFIGKLALVQCAIRRGLENAITEAHPTSELRLYVGLAVLILVNAAIGGWYYLRIMGALYFRKGKESPAPNRSVAALLTGAACVIVTIAVGVLPALVTRGIGEVPSQMIKANATVADSQIKPVNNH
jgi:NADH-quinone oxidoreductase subunit N